MTGQYIFIWSDILYEHILEYYNLYFKSIRIQMMRVQAYLNKYQHNPVAREKQNNQQYKLSWKTISDIFTWLMFKIKGRMYSR